MSKTEEYLKEAFAGESQANRKYLAFSQKAAEQGYHQAAKMFLAAAEAETVHAIAHLRAMDGVGDTTDNLKAAIEGETFEYKDMYPGMIEAAKAEGHKAAERSFDFANQVEKIHAELYEKVLANLKQGEAEYDYYVCPVCGYTCENEAPERCPVCNAKGSRFTKV